METSGKLKTRLSFQDILIKYNAIMILLILIIVSSLISPFFLTWRNITNVLLQQVPYLIISMGVMLTIMTAGIDLSVAAIAGCGNVLVAIICTTWGANSPGMLVVGILLALALGCTIGVLNGLLIGKLRMAPFIVTLAMMSAGTGLAYMMTGGAQIQMQAKFVAANALNWFGSARDPILNMPVAVYLAVIVVLVFWFIMRYTPFGRLVLAVGSNEAAVRLAGINVTKYKMIVYVICGGLAAMAGVFAAGRTALGAPSFANSDYALTTVAACVIGGVALEGGKGTVMFTVVGVLILALITNIMNLLGVASYPQQVIKGAIIILAIFMSKLGQKSSI